MSEIYRQFEEWWSKDKSQFTEDDELKNFCWVIWQASRSLCSEVNACKVCRYSSENEKCVRMRLGRF